jgi:hypothetical protein
MFLILVHLDDGAPVFCDFTEMQRVSEIDNVEDVLLKAAIEASAVVLRNERTTPSLTFLQIQGLL